MMKTDPMRGLYDPRAMSTHRFKWGGGANRRVITAGAVLMSCQYKSEILPSGRKLHGHLDKATESRLHSGNLSGSRLKDFSTYIIMSAPAGCRLQTAKA